MELTVLGSGGCAVIPKPLCRCLVCREARAKGPPYARTGPAVFIHDENVLIDAPAEIAMQLNRAGIQQLDYLLLTHLDPDHVEGLRIVEQITLDFRSWRGFPEKTIRLPAPRALAEQLPRLCSQYGSYMEYFQERGFIELQPFADAIRIGDLSVSAVGVPRGDQTSFLYVLEKGGRKLVYAPCDIKPFPENRPEIRNADLLVIQPGLFENGLQGGFVFPPDHISRTTLYTFRETLELANRIGARRILFVHLEEYWNRSHDDYRLLEDGQRIRFAYDGMRVAL